MAEKINTFYIDKIEMLSIGTMIRRFGKDNVTEILLTEREVDGHKELFIQSVMHKLLSDNSGRRFIRHDAVDEAIDCTMPEFFGSDSMKAS